MALIMFDMDGTLINSSKTLVDTINHVRENLGFEILESELILESVNDPKINAAEFFYGTTDFTLEQQKLFEEYYEANCLNGLELYDGIKKLVDDLSSDFTLAVATNANSFFAKKMLDHLEIGHHFNTILGFDSVKKAKPHPEMIHKILDKHEICNTKAQVIGDSHKDIMAASKAGVDSVLVNWGFSNHSQDAIETVDELEKRIKEKFSNQG